MYLQAPARAEYIRKVNTFMTDNEKRAHDIAVSLLPKSLELTNLDLFHWDKNDEGHIDSVFIIDAYMELYVSILNELKSR